MAVVEITLEIPLEVQEDLERMAQLHVFRGVGAGGVAEDILQMIVPEWARILCGEKGAAEPEPTGIIHARTGP